MSDAEAPSETEIDFDARIAARTDHVRLRLVRLGIIGGLRPEQQSRLTEIVARYDAAFELFQEYGQFQKWLRTDAKYGTGTRRALKQKVERAEDAIDDALKRITNASRGNELIARAFETLVTPHLREARESLARIRWSSKRLTQPTITRASALGRDLGADPKAAARAELSDLFLQDAKLSKRDADRQTALIEREFGWGRVALDDEYKGGDPGAKGSSAIRHSRTRRQRRDAARKPRR